MAKTYTNVPTVSTLATYPSATYNTYTAQNINNLIVPPTAQVRRTTDLTSYVSQTDISWTTTAAWDTDGMFSAGSPTLLTIQTAGLYMVTFTGQLTATATITRVIAQIIKNANGAAYQDSYGSSTEGLFACSVVLSCAASDTLSARVGINGGSAYVIKGTASPADSHATTRLTATWIGRTS